MEKVMKKSFCIIGLGKFGFSLAQTLIDEGNQVMVIDTDEEKISALADSATNAVIGDATNEKVLRSAGITNYDCVAVCVSGNLNDNVLLTIMLKEMGIKKVISRAHNESHKKVLERIGADIIVVPEQDMGEKLGYMLSRENVTEFIEFSGYKIVEMLVPKEWVGKTLIELDVRRKYGVNIVAVVSADDKKPNVSPSPMRPFVEGDKISIIGTDKDIEKLI